MLYIVVDNALLQSNQDAKQTRYFSSSTQLSVYMHTLPHNPATLHYLMDQTFVTPDALSCYGTARTGMVCK